jgi:hypothetical protein
MRHVDHVCDRLAMALVDDLGGALDALVLLQDELQVRESGSGLARLYAVEGAWDLLRFYLTRNYEHLVEGEADQ